MLAGAFGMHCKDTLEENRARHAAPKAAERRRAKLKEKETILEAKRVLRLKGRWTGKSTTAAPAKRAEPGASVRALDRLDNLGCPKSS